jgi:hypothetical protein
VAALAIYAVAAGASGRPDLRIAAVSAPAKSATIGSRVAIRATTRNAGAGRAGSSATGLYLSLDRRRDRSDRLIASSRVAALGSHKSVRRAIRAKVPRGTRPGRYFQLVCADVKRNAKEASETNNCKLGRVLTVKTSAGPSRPIGPPGKVANPTGDDDGDGFQNSKDCGPKDPNVNPRAEDLPDVPGFKDSNCDGVDGNASKAIFVAPTGNDTGPTSGSRGSPKRTLRAAIAAAGPQGKAVYAAGTFAERLDVVNGVSVYGGYAADWSRSQALAAETFITGAQTGNRVESAVANGVAAPTTLQLLSLLPMRGTGSGVSSYGLRAVDSPGLVLEYLHVSAGSGTAGTAGTSGANGRRGGNGAPGTAGEPNDTGGGQGGSGGTSPVGRRGGSGGSGGWEAPSSPGSPGLEPPDGGPGGAAGAYANPGQPGSNGYGGNSGAHGPQGVGGAGGTVVSGIWTTSAGTAGGAGTNGHGGGGGGGGGGQNTATVFTDGTGDGGGGGGGGGEGGRPGTGGAGGGGSFGIFLVNSSGAVIRNSVITSGNGGAGGGGGAGGRPGAGGSPGAGNRSNTDEVGAGGNGGPGGPGGPGGDGGGGAGGPSIGIYRMNSEITASGNILRTGAGGAGGVGSGPNGSAGRAVPELAG